MITYELKDRILSCLCGNEEMEGWFLQEEFAGEFSVSENVLIAILEQFESLGFMVNERTFDGVVSYRVTAAAHDFFSHGGFTAQE